MLVTMASKMDGSSNAVMNNHKGTGLESGLSKHGERKHAKGIAFTIDANLFSCSVLYDEGVSE